MILISAWVGYGGCPPLGWESSRPTRSLTTFVSAAQSTNSLNESRTFVNCVTRGLRWCSANRSWLRFFIFSPRDFVATQRKVRVRGRSSLQAPELSFASSLIRQFQVESTLPWAHRSGGTNCHQDPAVHRENAQVFPQTFALPTPLFHR